MHNLAHQNTKINVHRQGGAIPEKGLKINVH